MSRVVKYSRQGCRNEPLDALSNDNSPDSCVAQDYYFAVVAESRNAGYIYNSFSSASISSFAKRDVEIGSF